MEKWLYKDLSYVTYSIGLVEYGRYDKNKIDFMEAR